MKITIAQLLENPENYKICSNCEKINYFSNSTCIECNSDLLNYTVVNKSNLEGFIKFIGVEEGKTITINV